VQRENWKVLAEADGEAGHCPAWEQGTTQKNRARLCSKRGEGEGFNIIVPRLSRRAISPFTSLAKKELG